MELFILNCSAVNAGFIYISSSNNLNITNSSFFNGIASYGAHLFVFNLNSIYLENINFT